MEEVFKYIEDKIQSHIIYNDYQELMKVKFGLWSTYIRVKTNEDNKYTAETIEGDVDVNDPEVQKCLLLHVNGLDLLYTNCINGLFLLYKIIWAFNYVYPEPLKNFLVFSEKVFFNEKHSNSEKDVNLREFIDEMLL